MAKAPPSFQFYPSDFEMGTAYLDNESVGVYIRLLGHQWVMDGLPDDTAVLATLARESPQKFARVWPKIKDKFTKRSDNKLANKRLEEIRATSRKRASSGKRGGKKKASDLLSDGDKQT